MSDKEKALVEEVYQTTIKAMAKVALDTVMGAYMGPPHAEQQALDRFKNGIESAREAREKLIKVLDNL